MIARFDRPKSLASFDALFEKMTFGLPQWHFGGPLGLSGSHIGGQVWFHKVGERWESSACV